MADGKPTLHVQAHVASLALNERSGQNGNHSTMKSHNHSHSAPPTPHLQPKSSPPSAPAPVSAPAPAPERPQATPILAPAPQLSPVQGRTGRRLHTKVLEELKNVTSRNKSPAINPITAANGGHVPLPSPLSLNGGDLHHSQADTTQSSMGADGSSPRIPVPQHGNNGTNGATTTKAKMCGLCERSFTVFRAKHTCKVCSLKICDDCSKTRAKLNRRMERRKGSRICDSCARDYMQLATPVLTGAMEPRPLDGRRSSVGSDVAGFELGGRPPTEGNSANGAVSKHPATERFQRAASMVKQSIMASSRERAFVVSSSSASSSPSSSSSSSSSSFLRTRHWISLLCVAYLLAVRWLRFHTISTHGGFVVQNDPDNGNGGGGAEDLPDRELLVEAHGVALLFLSVTHWIDRVVSLRVLVSVVLGLVAYDELMAHTDRDRHARHHVPAQVGSARNERLYSQQTRLNGSVATSSPSCFSSATLAVGPPAAAVVRDRTKDEDEVLEVEVGDKPVDEAEGFSYEKLVASLVDCTTTTRAVGDNSMKMSGFLVACDFLCSFTTVFGRATSFAASTVSGYLTTISTNLAAWPVPANATVTPFSWKEESVRAVVLREVELKIASSGGKKKPSCSRCVLRLVWFIEFVEACVRYTLIENTDESCAAGASKAYEETIGSRHPWIIRKGVNSALGSLPTRSAILESLHLHEMSSDETIAHLREGQMAMRAMLTELTALLKEHNLLDIK